MSLTGAMWDRAREGIAPDAAQVAQVALEGAGALGAVRVGSSTHDLSSRVLGAGPLDGWLDDPTVTDVAVNGDGRVWVDRGQGMESVGPVLRPGEVRTLAVRLAGAAGRRLDESRP